MFDELTPRPPQIHRNIISNSIINLEDELHVRDDFIDIFENVLQNTDKSLRIRYLSADNSLYYNEIDNARKFVNNFGVSKIQNLKKSMNNLNFFGGILGLGDSVITIGIALGFFIFAGSYFTRISEIVSWGSAILTIILTLFGGLLVVISKSESTVKEILKILVVTRSTFKSTPHVSFSKNRLMAVYIWDHSLCKNTGETIRGFLILLMVKAISKKIFAKIKYKLIKITPVYLSKKSEGQSKLRFLLYVIRNSFNP